MLLEQSGVRLAYECIGISRSGFDEISPVDAGAFVSSHGRKRRRPANGATPLPSNAPDDVGGVIRSAEFTGLSDFLTVTITRPLAGGPIDLGRSVTDEAYGTVRMSVGSGVDFCLTTASCAPFIVVAKRSVTPEAIDFRSAEGLRSRYGAFSLLCPGETIVLSTIAPADFSLIWISADLIDEVAIAAGTNGFSPRSNIIDMMDREVSRLTGIIDPEGAALSGATPDRDFNVHTITLLVSHLLRNYNARARDDRMPSRAAELPDVVSHIAGNLGERLVVSEIAEFFRFKESDLNHLFERTYGLTPYQFILDQRIKSAADLLSKSDTPISAIAIDCGFSSQAHLTSAFKAHVGVPPGRYRKAVGPA